MDVVVSRNGVPIRLTDERWRHIATNHDDLAPYSDEVLQTIEDPQLVLRGYTGALLAVRRFGRRQYLVVVYRELGPRDVFVITAYLAGRINRRAQLWPKGS